MQTKLTLRMEDKLIDRAKIVAEKRGKSLSRMVADYFSVLTQENPKTQELPPNIQSLYGALSGSKLDEKDYKKHLESKYL